LIVVLINLTFLPDMPSNGNEKKNYNSMMEILNVVVCEGLRKVFKQEWDKHYGTSKGLWDDTCISGNELYNMEKPRSHAKPYLNSYQSGKRSEWDMSALSDAILFSNALKKHLAPHVSNKVDELRVLRNHLTHKFGSQHKMPDAAFNNACRKVKNCFKVLKLSTANVEGIRISLRGNYAIHLTKIMYICLPILVGVSYYWFTNAIEAKSLFRVLPSRPVHLVANRSRTVNAILDELRNLSIRNNHALTYLYISGNPGSGKSQLARLVGQRYGKRITFYWLGSYTFVMTLNGRSLHDILESYADFARSVECNENNIENIINSQKTTTAMKIQSLRTEIAKMLKNFKNRCTWLLIADSVIKLDETSSFLPQLEDEDWQGGQVLITTQDMSSVPSNSSLTVHISVSRGMDLVESREFLTDLSGLVENQHLLTKVAKELDYQPLALASAAFYVKRLRESNAFSQFSWKNYLKKLHEGRRNLTEMKLTKVNQAYSLTMSTAVLLAVKTFSEGDLVLKHAFTFLSYVSHEPLSLDIIVSYVVRVEKDTDEEDVRLRMRQCSLILASDNQKSVSISLHRVVFDSIQLHIARDSEEDNKSRVPLYVFQLLLEYKDSIKIKQETHEHLFNLTSTLIEYGEFLLSKKYLILALKIVNRNVEANLRSTTKAKEYHQRALEIFKAQYGKQEHVQVVTHMALIFTSLGTIDLGLDSYYNLGLIHFKLNELPEAEDCFRHALEIYYKQLGPSHEMIAMVSAGLAGVLKEAGQSNEAAYLDKEYESFVQKFNILIPFPHFSRSQHTDYYFQTSIWFLMLRKALSYYEMRNNFYSMRPHAYSTNVRKSSLNRGLLNDPFYVTRRFLYNDFCICEADILPSCAYRKFVSVLIANQRQRIDEMTLNMVYIEIRLYNFTWIDHFYTNLAESEAKWIFFHDKILLHGS
ncbi:Myotubularin-related 14, partial [Paramuricea clavata]